MVSILENVSITYSQRFKIEFSHKLRHKKQKNAQKKLFYNICTIPYFNPVIEFVNCVKKISLYFLADGYYEP